jgi:hypothetical protein
MMVRREKTVSFTFRCPEKLYNKIFELNDDKGISKSNLMIMVLENAFTFLELFNKMVENCTDSQRDKIVGKSINSLTQNKRGDLFEFSEIYEESNRK